MLSRRKFLKFGFAGGAAALLASQSKLVGQVYAAAQESPLAAQFAQAAAATVQVPLPGSAIPQFVDPLPALELLGGSGSPLTLNMVEFKTNMLPNNMVLPVPPGAVAPPPYTGTVVWGYLQPGQTARESYLGPVIVNERGIPTEIKFVNDLGSTATSNLLAYTQSTDQTLHWADPLNGQGNMCNMMQSLTPMGYCSQNYSGPIPAAVHLHGGEVPPELDGGPDSWFLSQLPDMIANPNAKMHGSGFYSKDGNLDGNYTTLRYPNTQEGGLIWFHDHTLGATRLNVYAGLAGAYLIIDPASKFTNPFNFGMPVIPMVIQDRMFDTNGQLFFPAGVPNIPNPEHPFWVPEFVGDTICVNGKAWPYLNVESKRYLFLIINGSNARTYEMSLTNQTNNTTGPVIWQVGTDGGLLDAPVKIDPKAAALPRLVMMPGERAWVVVDFGGLPAGTTLVLKNVAKTPYPAGAAPRGNTTGRIMQFRVTQAAAADTSWNPAAPTEPLRPAMVRLANAPAVKRQMTLNEVMGMPTAVNGIAYPGGPLEILVNNTKWSGESSRPYQDFEAVNQNGIVTHYSEVPQEGQLELWEFINLTADAHPMHTHLTQFQILNRQAFDVAKYTAAYDLAFPGGMGLDVMTGMEMMYPPNVYVPTFGPPLDYNVANLDGALGGNPAVKPFLKGPLRLPAANELGWKDTILTPPGMVTRILVRYAPMDTPASTAAADAAFPFSPMDAQDPYGYVWHCHIVDHEDNEMMRPLLVKPNLNPAVVRTFIKGVDY